MGGFGVMGAMADEYGTVSHCKQINLRTYYQYDIAKICLNSRLLLYSCQLANSKEKEWITHVLDILNMMVTCKCIVSIFFGVNKIS